MREACLGSSHGTLNTGFDILCVVYQEDGQVFMLHDKTKLIDDVLESRASSIQIIVASLESNHGNRDGLEH